MEIQAIARDLNDHASEYAIHTLQTIRKRLKGLKRLPLSNGAIFHSSTVDAAGDWAFHYGGRSELQFNIGNEIINGEDCIRYGVAFSLEPSQTLPDVSVLFPKIRRFNEYTALYPDAYDGFRIWYWNGARTELFDDRRIRSDFVVRGCFIFFGKYVRREAYSPHPILRTFEELLPLYEYVEGPANAEPLSIVEGRPFVFAPSSFERVVSTRYTAAQKIIDVNLRHMAIQSALFKRLCVEHGSENVAAEISSGVGVRVDIVVRSNDGYWFYEVKTGDSARACLREALGQLLEYSFWPGAQPAARLIVVGEPALDSRAESYLAELQRRFTLPIQYQQQVIAC